MKNIKLFVSEFIKNNLLFHSAQTAFYFVLSLFPLLYILTKTLTIIPLPSTEILKSLEMFFPEETLKIIYSNLKSISNTSVSANSTPYIGVALWSSSMLIYSLKSLFGTFYGKKVTQNKICIRILSIFLTSVILTVIIFTLMTVFFVNTVINVLVRKLSIKYSRLLLSLLSFVLIIFDVVLLYIILPPKRIKLLQAFPGALIAIISLTVSSYGFSYYINYIADYSRFYGAMESMIILLLWFYICSIIILSGGLINSKFIK